MANSYSTFSVVTTTATAGTTFSVTTGGSSQYERTPEDELQAILARAEADLKKANAGNAAAAERYRYRGIESVRTRVSKDRKNAVSVSVPVALIAEGEHIIDWIWRWSALPLVGPIVMDHLADQLDRLTDALSKRVPE